MKPTLGKRLRTRFALLVDRLREEECPRCAEGGVVRLTVWGRPMHVHRKPPPQVLLAGVLTRH